MTPTFVGIIPPDACRYVPGMSKKPRHMHLLSCDEMVSLGLPVGDLLEALEDDLGPQAVWKLTGTCGGRAIYIPVKDTHHRSVLVKRLGRELAGWLCDRLGSGLVQIPLGPHCRVARNLATCRALLLKGKSRPHIASAMNCHTRTVERMTARLRKAGFIQTEKDLRT